MSGSVRAPLSVPITSLKPGAVFEFQGVRGRVVAQLPDRVRLERRVAHREESKKRRTRKRGGVRPYYTWVVDEWSKAAVVRPL